MFKKLFPFFCFVLVSVPMFGQTPEQAYFEWTEIPFSKEELAERRTKLIKQLQDLGKKGIVVIPAKDGFSFGETFRQLDNFYYFTGLEIPNSILVLDISGASAKIFTPQRDLRFESTKRPNDFPGRPLLNDPAIANQAGISLAAISEFSVLMNAKAAEETTVFIDNGRPGEIRFASEDYMSSPTPVQILLNALQSKHKGLQFENMYTSLAKVRMIKSAAEIEIMRKSTAINIRGIKNAAKAIKAGIDERYLEGILEGDYKVNGAHRLAFGSIIKSGPNSLWPWRILATHYNRRNRNLENGELVVFDVGCEYKNYVSDVGRTFPVSGTFTEKQKEILTMEVGIADQIINFIKPGITFADLKGLTEQIIPQEAKKSMQVGVFCGHHLGLSTGDPNLSAALLQPGMVFTVEPWYYNHDQQISVFTEDVILVTKNGCEVLSKGLPRTPDALEKLMKK
jgi:Xaa-Pro aminopeptidase